MAPWGTYWYFIQMGSPRRLTLTREMYGLERFKALISKNRHLSPESLKTEILSDLHAHQQGENANDDITLVVAKFL